MSKAFKAPAFEIKLSESGEVPKTVQVLRTGSFKDKRYGRFPVTSDMLLAMKKNFDSRVRGIDPAIDYAHKSDEIAAGWMKGLELRNDNKELWAEVDWTSSGSRVLAEKEFRYISADFTTNYEDNETGKSFGPTLNGAGLTNRPVIKGMAPAVELSEQNGEDQDMTLEQAQARIAELEAAAKTTEAQLAEANKAIEGHKANEKKLAEEKEKAEKSAKFDKLLSEGKVVEAQREAFLSGDAVKLAELAAQPNLDGKGHSQTDAGKKDGEGAGKDPEAKVLELAEKKMSEKHASDLGSAISMVLSENAELRKEYEKATQ